MSPQCSTAITCRSQRAEQGWVGKSPGINITCTCSSTVPCGDWPRVEAFCAGKEKLTFFWNCTASGLTLGLRLNTYTPLQSTLATLLLLCNNYLFVAQWVMKVVKLANCLSWIAITDLKINHKLSQCSSASDLPWTSTRQMPVTATAAISVFKKITLFCPKQLRQQPSSKKQVNLTAIP